MKIFATFGKNSRNIPEFGPNPVNNWLNTRWILNYLSRKHEDVVSSVVGYNGEIPWCLWSIQVTSDRVALTSRKYLILYWTFVLSVIFQSQNHVEHFDTVLVPTGSLGIWRVHCRPPCRLVSHSGIYTQRWHLTLDPYNSISDPKWDRGWKYF